MKTLESVENNIIEFNVDKEMTYVEVFFDNFVYEMPTTHIEELLESDKTITKEIIAEVIYSNYLEEVNKLEKK